MYAVVAVGGKQLRVAQGDRVKIEKIDADVGAQVDLGPVLLIGGGEDARVGAPVVEGARVTAQVVQHAKARKVIVFKKRRRKNYRRKNGHRQPFTEVLVTGISVGAGPAEA
jgi:large subunit ribosomal protein L21